MAVEVTHQGANLQANNLLTLYCLHQPLVHIQLLLPLNLVLHDCPRRGELVVDQDHTLVSLLLEVNRTTDGHPIHLMEQTLLHDPAIGNATLHDHMQG